MLLQEVRGEKLVFVTVGTHEQSFNRLVKCIDELKGNGVIHEEVIIQIGFSTYEPSNCVWRKLLSYQEMIENVAAAHIVITHGGPSSFFMPLQIGKIPIVVPRQKKYKEHVNNHQVDFSKAVAERIGNIIVVKEMNQLERAILEYDSIVKEMSIELKNNNAIFNANLKKIVEELLEVKK